MVCSTPFPNRITRSKLAKIRTKAIRKGVWFRLLNKAERAQIELTIRTVKRVRSLLLTRVLTFLLIKLFNALENKVERLMMEVGQHLAERIGLVAQSWNHASSVLWKAEHNFVRYITVMYMNTPEEFEP